ncbi:hypothetical protein QTP70_010222 [Hemibagrus guttatus]|uniref:CCHC-type domain-containing protein n=1 Tax=Hemibagrus guttatus TaxID=175788 RepID=A0AAE0PQY6_9TELE|nr:hypothetical protein QTP70_010222 [Hemibagrus guttatus]
MASLAQRVASPLSLRNGVRCVPANGVTVEEVLLGIGKEIGYDSISSASRMNKAVVVFVKEESHVRHLTNVGIVVSGEFVLVSPLIAPTVRVTVSNMPPFIPNGEIERGLTRYGKLASVIRTVPLGCKNGALKHVMSFRRHVFMFLNEQELDVWYRVGYEGRTYMVYASTGNMKCFECGDVGHKRLVCPHKAQASEEAPSQGNERATRLGSREETRQGNKEGAEQGSKEEAIQGSKEEDVQEIEEEDVQEIEEEDVQDGGVQQSAEGDGRLNIQESTITDKVAREMEGVQTVNTDKSRAQVVEITETMSDNGDENIVNLNIEMVEPAADDVMSEVDEVSGSEGITGATGENRGRVLVVNNLAASTLWHKTNVMEPPEELVSSIQRSIVDFFWSGQHWLRAAVLYLPVQEGGQGLVDVRSRIRAFRIQAAQRLLYHKDVVWEKTAGAILRRVGGFRLDKHLFLMELKELSLSELTPYYRSMLHTWRTVIRTERDMDNLEQCTPEEPLFFNPCMQSRLLSSVSIRKCLLGNGITKLPPAERGRLDTYRRAESSDGTEIFTSSSKTAGGTLQHTTKQLQNIHRTETRDYTRQEE